MPPSPLSQLGKPPRCRSTSPALGSQSLIQSFLRDHAGLGSRGTDPGSPSLLCFSPSIEVLEPRSLNAASNPNVDSSILATWTYGGPRTSCPPLSSPPTRILLSASFSLQNLISPSQIQSVVWISAARRVSSKTPTQRPPNYPSPSRRHVQTKKPTFATNPQETTNVITGVRGWQHARLVSSSVSRTIVLQVSKENPSAAHH
ncbi:hypothetical protein VTJ04DRAFT_7855 [Mycothermus thermophilus]|uniref:uncharacterized protein n=1 Tax=Humicola insolens TaxID=85995 RepID=UPI003742C977